MWLTSIYHSNHINQSDYVGISWSMRIRKKTTNTIYKDNPTTHQMKMLEMTNIIQTDAIK